MKASITFFLLLIVNALLTAQFGFQDRVAIDSLNDLELYSRLSAQNKSKDFLFKNNITHQLDSIVGREYPGFSKGIYIYIYR